MQTVELLDKREQVMRLFTANGNSDSSEIHEYLFTLARKICEASHVSSDIKLKQLVGKFDGSKLPEEPVEINTYLDYLAENVAAHSTHTSSPRFIGHMTSALPFFVQPLSQFITALNQNTVKTETAKACTPLERQTLAFMHRLVYDLPDEFYRRHTQAADSTLGIMVSGGTIGNITALWCARNVSLSSRNGFPGVEAAGLTAALKDYGYEGAVVIGSSLMHYSLEKTADLLGIGTCGLVRVATDKHNRMDVDALRRTVAECRARRLLIIAIIGIAGTTDVGSIDPLAEIAKLAQEEGIHFHVDAAWGGPLLFSRRYKHLLSGIEQADSVTIDGHKQLYLPLGVGILVFRNPFLAQAIQKQARYIVRATSIDLGKRALEGSRPANALLLHAALHLVGPQGYEFLIDEGIRKTRYFAGLLRTDPAFELLGEPEINILNYRYVPAPLRERVSTGNLSEDDLNFLDQFNEALQKTQRQAGRTFVSRTRVETARYGAQRPLVALRAVLANPMTTKADLHAVLADQVDIARQIGFAVGQGKSAGR
ncbi:MAG TPA: putative pyridoxal-dependent aspartate 1-decarboxylase [Pyrinomonadaceae bacterium]|jgi:glutamate decarboxylase|nr:putative pyridoxal-dependent aspartate 1-decarboxylase [Pyrinomonadaceae bacterium]